MGTTVKKYDLFFALLLSLAAGLLLFRFCDNTHYEGDDFAAYILQATALAEGRVEEQLRLNLFMHPSVIYNPSTAADTLTYVWGYPMLLLPVYLLRGFDIAQPLNIFFYKLPGLFSLSLFAGVLYLFYRRRFGVCPSVVLCLCMVFSIMEDANRIQTDYPFLLFSLLCFLLSELWFQRNPARPHPALALGLGLSMWATVQLRLNGFTVSLLILLEHLFLLAKTRPRGRALAAELSPHLLLWVFTAVTALLLPVPTSNLSDVGLGSLSQGWAYFVRQMYDWSLALTSYSLSPFQLPLMVLLTGLFFLGLVCRLRQDSGYALFILGTVLVNISLPYNQGLRYFYNILPLMLLFVGWGCRAVYAFLLGLWSNLWYRRTLAGLTLAGMVLFSGVRMLSVYSTACYLASENRESAGLAEKNLYSDSCLEAYAFLRAQTPPEAVIAFYKPRALYLNTDRVAFRVGINGHTLDEADYYMEFAVHHGTELPEEAYHTMEIVFDNGQILIYRCSPSLSDSRL